MYGAIARLCGSMGALGVAKAIDSEEIINWMNGLGYDEGKGFHVGAPGLATIPFGQGTAPAPSAGQLDRSFRISPSTTPGGCRLRSNEIVEVSGRSSGLVVSGGPPVEISGAPAERLGAVGRENGAWTLATSRSWSRSCSTRPGTN